MPWKVRSVVDERMKFVSRVLAGEPLAAVCRDFGISRKTGTKFWKRYQEEGPEGLLNRSRATRRNNKTLCEILEKRIVDLRKEKPYWGAPKLKELFIRRYPNVRAPSISTFHAVIKRNGLVKEKRKRALSSKATGTYLSVPKDPNDLWCTDYKGQFLLGNQEYCYPLTITDSHSRYLLGCEAFYRINHTDVFTVFDRTFKEYGLPKAIRSDNGVPFGHPQSLFTLSPLSVWWLSLGIKVERIRPGHPEQNGRHERMHRTLKRECTKPPKKNLLQQQERFYEFVDEYNLERPHQSIDMKTPSEVYKKSNIEYDQYNELEYPLCDKTVKVTQCGGISLNGVHKRIFISKSFGGHNLGLKEEDDKIWSIYFMDHEIGCYDEKDKSFSPISSPLDEHV
mgnify:CR=1 FL=1